MHTTTKIGPPFNKKNRWIWIVPTAIAVMIINVAVHVLYMVAYSYVINPGHEAAYYQEHARITAPYSSIVVGMPLMFFACRWIGKKFELRFVLTGALLVWLVYFLIDITIITLAGQLSNVALLFIISFGTKLAAAYLGGLAARKQVKEQ